MSPEDAGSDQPTTGASEQEQNAVRGWQALSEQRGAQLAEAQARIQELEGRLSTMDNEQRVRQLAELYPDAFGELQQHRGSVSAADEDTLKVLQRALDGKTPLIDANQPRRPGPAPEKTQKQMSGQELKDLFESEVRKTL